MSTFIRAIVIIYLFVHTPNTLGDHYHHSITTSHFDRRQRFTKSWPLLVSGRGSESKICSTPYGKPTLNNMESWTHKPVGYLTTAMRDRVVYRLTNAAYLAQKCLAISDQVPECRDEDSRSRMLPHHQCHHHR
ncbi:hypothetical protein EDB86DRAFT_1825230 [Lactarius hatsudake]|nr:hypothetical protein EDB86DRAFT_1825230 [Lactarius hatsudake]